MSRPPSENSAALRTYSRHISPIIAAGSIHGLSGFIPKVGVSPRSSTRCSSGASEHYSASNSEATIVHKKSVASRTCKGQLREATSRANMAHYGRWPLDERPRFFGK